MRIRSVAPAAAVLALLLATSPVAAQELDLEGRWSLSVTTFVSTITFETSADKGRGETSCNHEGTADIKQDGTSFSGDATLQLVDGGPPCPDEMMATIDGMTGMGVGGTLTSPDFGTSDFVGTEDKASGGPFSGSHTVTSGPFAGSAGSWSAVVAPVSLAIPTLGGVGFALLAGLLLTAGLFVLRRRSTA